MERGRSGLSLVVGVDKPLGLSSHDVVNRVRRIFDERRVGHAGTLDPQATGILPMLIGPATRLDRYLTGHDKVYRALIAFGTSTTTDDGEGEVLKSGPLVPALLDAGFAQEALEGFLGPQRQIPPVYSAVKVDGVRAYAASRRGNIIDLEPRDITIHRAELIDIVDEDGQVLWDVRLGVSKGTYIRAIARDIGHSVGVPAHLGALRRERVGAMALSDCVTLPCLEEVGARAALDPVALLGFTIAFPREDALRLLANGNKVPREGFELFDHPVSDAVDGYGMCACTSGLRSHGDALSDGMLVSVVVDNALKAIYGYDGERGVWKPHCIFSTEVSRGLGI